VKRATLAVIPTQAGPVDDEAPAPVEAVAEERKPSRVRGARADLIAIGLYLLAAGYVTERLWRFLHTFSLRLNGTDQIQVEYFAEHAVRVITKGDNPFYLDQLNVPGGVNLMANTATLGLNLPLVPVTMLFGADVTLVVELVLGLAGTAAAWYWLFSRHLVRSRVAAFVAGTFVAFAPGMISQANGHPNITAQFLIPFIIWLVLRLRDREHAWRNRIVLAVLAAYQMFINEEVLFAFGLAMVVFLVAWAVANRTEARAAAGVFLRGIAVSGGIVLVLLAYPLYLQFFGAQAYHGLWAASSQKYGNDIFSFVNFAEQSLAGFSVSARHLSANPTEQNTFFGWPLLILVGFLVVMYWRRTVLRSVMIAGLVMAVLSCGPVLLIDGHRFASIPLPYRALSHLPIFDSVITGRLVLVALPAIGALLAVWLDEWYGRRAFESGHRLRVRLLGAGVVLAALLPLAPEPVPIVARPVTPQFFATGEWRSYVPAGRSVVTVPLTSLSGAMDGMQWAVGDDLEWSQPGGYFLGPNAQGQGYFGPVPRSTDKLLAGVLRTGAVPAIGPTEQADALADLKYWRAAIVVLNVGKKNADELRETVTQLLGVTPREVDGVWLWDVRQLT
jgi:hypothetical protein